MAWRRATSSPPSKALACRCSSTWSSIIVFLRGQRHSLGLTVARGRHAESLESTGRPPGGIIVHARTCLVLLRTLDVPDPEMESREEVGTRKRSANSLL